MKVLIDGRPMLRPWMGGVPRLASGLVPALVEAWKPNESVIVTSGFGQGLPNKLVAALAWTGLSSYDRFFKKERADILFLPNLEFVGQPKLPYALLVHDLSFLIEPRWFGWKSRLWHKLVKPRQLIKNASHLFAVSETTKRDLVDLVGVSADKITVIPLGLDMEIPSDVTRYSLLDTRYILTLGGTRKNVECVIAAHGELIKEKKYSDIQLVMTGGSSPNPLLNMRRGQGGGGIEVGRPSYADLFALMRDAAIFCYPSWYEGFGMPLHEAAHFGTPCIASTAGALPETAPKGTLFASPAKPQHWVEAIKTILDEPVEHRTKTDLRDWKPAAEIISKKLLELAP